MGRHSEEAGRAFGLREARISLFASGRSGTGPRLLDHQGDEIAIERAGAIASFRFFADDGNYVDLYFALCYYSKMSAL